MGQRDGGLKLTGIEAWIEEGGEGHNPLGVDGNHSFKSLASWLDYFQY